MDVFLLVMGCLLMFLGIIGCIIPALPGPPISYLGLLLMHFTSRVELSSGFLITWAVITFIVTILDYIIPAWGTKKSGGSRYGVWGSILGLIVGIFFGPIGIIAGPFVGAVLGELVSGKRGKETLKAGFGSFLGFMSAVVLKLIASGFMLFFYIRELIALW